MKLKLFTLVLALSTVPAVATDDPREMKPNEVQGLQLQVAQRDAVIAQRDLQTAQLNYQRALAALSAKAAEIKKENKWPDTVTFNPNTLSYCIYGIAADGSTCLPKPADKDPDPAKQEKKP